MKPVPTRRTRKASVPPLVTVTVRSSVVLVAAVADRDLDQIDIVAVGVGRRLEVGRLGEGEGAGGGDRESGPVGPAGQREGQRIAVRIVAVAV